jgi:hypothetical protein
MFKLNKARAALAVLASMALALGVAVSAPSAQGANSDLYMMSYDQYTYALNNGLTVENSIKVGPTNDWATPTYFSSESAASAVKRTVYDGHGLDVALNTVTSHQVGASAWETEAQVTLPSNTTYGVISMKYCNPTKMTACTNISVMRLAPTTVATTSGIAVRVYDPADSSGATYYSTTGQVIQSSAVAEMLGTNYPSGIDGIVQVGQPGSGIAQVTSVTQVPYTGLGNMVTAMTVNNTAWANSGSVGWQYAVYHLTGGQLHRVNLSEYVGSDVFRLQSGDTEVWKRGPMSDYSALFPSTIT